MPVAGWRLVIERLPGTVRIYWQDSAPGVNDEQLALIFERFYRTEGSRNRASGGSGLGLSICQNIVEAHGGEIRAQHSPLGGVRITVDFPISGE
ncbi:Signal transduction histidine-protein kinase BaeS [Serratia fonticola]|uniref:histidine kinase n=1 Tax=Serratia fonticola TaxID=47917 RepID=A0A4U9WIH8_SERFO|nr:Signal transduction histidine-protein kinase BaeS [Serratia fonticola]